MEVNHLFPEEQIITIAVYQHPEDVHPDISPEIQIRTMYIVREAISINPEVQADQPATLTTLITEEADLAEVHLKTIQETGVLPDLHMTEAAHPEAMAEAMVAEAEVVWAEEEAQEEEDNQEHL